MVRIKLGSPIFFKQKRTGKDEKTFEMIKFRTMTDARDENGQLLPDTERFTKFGNFLRNSSLDELPELLNVIKGDMSLIGPRPLYPFYLPYYTEKESLRHSVRGGITGLAQVNGRALLRWNDRFEKDIEYISNITFWGDIKILWMTFYKVFKQDDIGIPSVTEEGGLHIIRKVQRPEATLGEIVDLLEEFKSQPISIMMPKCPDGSFAKKLFSLYLTYLPTDRFKYAMKMNCDDRGSFTELVHTVDCGQISINISKPGITKGQHWHNSKWEQFIVVHGHGLIQERNINTGETVEFEVSGDKIEAIYMIPGWTHNIINLSETDDLVTVMTCNEIFDPTHPDTFFDPV